MNLGIKPLLMVMALLALGIAALALLREKPTEATPKVFVFAGKGTDWVDHAQEIWAACPGLALSDEKGAEYSLMMRWTDSGWEAHLFRQDSAYLFTEDSPDFSKVLRDACKVIRHDLPQLLANRQRNKIPTLQPGESESSNRYELHDVRNGSLATSALLDKRTGRIWLLSSVRNRNGSTKVEFEAQDVFNYTDHPMPDPEAKIAREPQDSQYVRMPDGTYRKFPANATDTSIKAEIEREFPNAFKTISPKVAAKEHASEETRH